MNLVEDHLYAVSEIFTSIQGEGRFAGTPATFVRFYGCNLACSWCDASYAVPELIEKRNLKEEFEVYKQSDLAKKIISMRNRHVILTGGEPLAQARIEELIANVFKMAPKQHNFEIETNGTIILETPYNDRVVFDISPKLNNSQMNKTRRYNLPALEWYAKNANAIFKFVLEKPTDILEVLDDFVIPLNLPAHQVYLMPLGVDTKTLQQNSKWIINMCEKYGFNYSPRLHIWIWGNKRGT